ncbi:MAG: hypothetical protein SGPRY_002723 [Prymnesium sp.]
MCAWVLHEAGILPLQQWLSLLSPSDRSDWANALRSLHERAVIGPPSDQTRLLQPLLTHLCSSPHDSLRGGGEGGEAPSLVQSFLGPSAADGKGREAAISFDSSAVLRGLSVLRCFRSHALRASAEEGVRSLLSWLLRPSHAAKASPLSPLNAAARAAQRLILLRGEEGGGDKEESAQQERLAAEDGDCGVEVEEVGRAGGLAGEKEAREVLKTLQSFVSEARALVGDDILALLVMDTHFPGSSPSHAGHWLLLLNTWGELLAKESTSAHGAPQASPHQLLFERCRALLSEARDESAITPSLSLLVLASHTLHRLEFAPNPPTSPDYTDWLHRVAADACPPDGRASCTNGTTKRAACRLLRSLCALVPFLDVQGLRLHLRVAKAWAKAAPSAVDEHQALVRTRLVDLNAPECAKSEGVEREEGKQAERVLEQALEQFEGDGRLPRALMRVRIAQPQLWHHKIRALLLAPQQPPPPGESTEARRTRMHRAQLMQRLQAELVKAKMLSKPKEQTDLETAGPSRTPIQQMEVTDAPLDWDEMLQSLPEALARDCKHSGEQSGFQKLVIRMAPRLRPVGSDGVESALQSAGSLSNLLRQLVEGFAACLAAVGVSAVSTWSALYVEHLLWLPQNCWPQFHVAFWSWFRLALFGDAGAHQRPLALLLCHLAALERAHAALHCKPPSSCSACANQFRVCRSVSGALRGTACQIEPLLAHLPIESAASRTWAMRLGCSALLLVCTAFDEVRNVVSPCLKV